MPEITVTVKCSNDQKYSVTIDTSKTVLEFKNAIAEQSNTAADKQRLIYSGRVLKDNDTLETYKITEGHTVHMVRSQASSDTSQTSSRTIPSATTSENPSSTTQPGVPPSTFPAINPFTQFGLGSSNQSPYGLPNGMMEQILQNPEMMQQMQHVFQNPAFVESMISMYPNLSQVAPQIRRMMQDPEVLALISNPEVLRNVAMMGPTLGPTLFGGAGGTFPGFPGLTTPAPNTNNNTSATPVNPSSGTTNADTTAPANPSSRTTNTDTTTPVTPANNMPYFNLFNPAATTNTGTNPAQAPVIPLLDFWEAFAVPPVTSPAAPQIPPEERFQVQLQQLNEMGFFDAQKNIRALQVCQGNVQLAIERLLDPSFN